MTDRSTLIAGKKQSDRLREKLSTPEGRTQDLCSEVCKNHWGRYTSPDDLNAAIIAIAKAEAQKAGEER